MRPVVLSIIVGISLHGAPLFLYAQAPQDSAEPEFDPFPAAAESSSSNGGSSRPRASARISDDDPESEAEDSGFRFPTLPKPKFPTLPKPTLPKLSMPEWATTKTVTRETMRQPVEPSAWEKFSTGSKEMMAKTKRTLMPWAAEEEPQRRPTSTARRAPTRTASRPKSRTAAAEKKPLFPWFSPKEEQDDPFQDGVNGFLKQPRPQ